jgi:hypothetical protein
MTRYGSLSDKSIRQQHSHSALVLKFTFGVVQHAVMNSRRKEGSHNRTGTGKIFHEHALLSSRKAVVYDKHCRRESNYRSNGDAVENRFVCHVFIFER